MRGKRIISILTIMLLIMTFVSGCAVTNDDNAMNLQYEANRSLYENFDYGDDCIYVIGHKSPDTDTVTSSIAMANLLNELGITAKPALAGNINNETKMVLNELGVEIPEVLEDASGKQLFLVDHSEVLHGVNGIENARIVGICDHHGFGTITTKELINAISKPAGSTSSLVYEEYIKCGIDIDPKLASIMLSGLLSDKGIIDDDEIAFDKRAYDNLLALSDIDNVEAFYERMQENLTNYDGLSDRDIFYNDYKDYECNNVIYGIGIVNTKDISEVEPVSQRMQTIMDEEIKLSKDDLLFVMVCDEDYELQYIGCAGKDEAFANKVFQKIFENFDNGEYKDGFYTLTDTIGRKKIFVPRIDEVLTMLVK